MKTKLIIAAGALAMLMTGCEPCKTASTEKTSLVTEKDKYSYALGAHFGNQARFQLVTRDSIDLDLDLFIQAFKERYNSDSAKFLMNDSVIMETLNKLSADRQAEKMKKDSIAAEKNKAEGEAFLAQNKTAEGVVTTQSGLQYKIVTEGTGATPTENDKVKVHYTGTLLNGEKFDSSVDRGQPLEFPVTAVIPGWTEMLKLMKVGERLSHGSRATSLMVLTATVLSRVTAFSSSKWNFSMLSLWKSRLKIRSSLLNRLSLPSRLRSNFRF